MEASEDRKKFKGGVKLTAQEKQKPLLPVILLDTMANSGQKKSELGTSQHKKDSSRTSLSGATIKITIPGSSKKQQYKLTSVQHMPALEKKKLPPGTGKGPIIETVTANREKTKHKKHEVKYSPRKSRVLADEKVIKDQSKSLPSGEQQGKTTSKAKVFKSHHHLPVTPIESSKSRKKSRQRMQIISSNKEHRIGEHSTTKRDNERFMVDPPKASLMMPHAKKEQQQGASASHSLHRKTTEKSHKQLGLGKGLTFEQPKIKLQISPAEGDNVNSTEPSKFRQDASPLYYGRIAKKQPEPRPIISYTDKDDEIKSQLQSSEEEFKELIFQEKQEIKSSPKKARISNTDRDDKNETQLQQSKEIFKELTLHEKQEIKSSPKKDRLLLTGSGDEDNRKLGMSKRQPEKTSPVTKLSELLDHFSINALARLKSKKNKSRKKRKHSVSSKEKTNVESSKEKANVSIDESGKEDAGVAVDTSEISLIIPNPEERQEEPFSHRFLVNATDKSKMGTMGTAESPTQPGLIECIVVEPSEVSLKVSEFGDGYDKRKPNKEPSEISLEVSQIDNKETNKLQLDFRLQVTHTKNEGVSSSEHSKQVSAMGACKKKPSHYTRDECQFIHDSTHEDGKTLSVNMSESYPRRLVHPESSGDISQNPSFEGSICTSIYYCYKLK